MKKQIYRLISCTVVLSVLLSFVTAAADTSQTESTVILKRLWTETFESFNINQGSSNPQQQNGMFISKSGTGTEAYLANEQVDTTYGKSLKMGIQKGETQAQTARDNFYLNIPSDKSTAVYEFDFNISGKGNNTRFNMIELKGESGGQLQKIIFRDKIYVDGVGTEYAENTWYTMRMEFSVAEKECNVYLEDTPIGSFDISAITDKVSVIRLYTRRNETTDFSSYESGFMSIDNFSYCEYVVPGKPEVSFSGYEAGETYELQRSESIPITVDATADDGEISKVELFVDDELFETVTEAPYVFDIGSCGVGTFTVKAVAYTQYGYGEASIACVIPNTVLGPIWTETFDDKFNLNDTTGDNQHGIGIIKSDVSDSYVKLSDGGETHNNILEIGIEHIENAPLSERGNPYATVQIGKQQGIYQFDFKVIGKGNTTRYAFIGFKDSTGSSNQEVQRILFRDKLYIGDTAIDYNEDTWYTMRLEFDVEAKLCDVYLDNVKAGTFSIKEIDDNVDFIRIYHRRIVTDSIDNYTAGAIMIDNFSECSYAQLPEVSAVSADIMKEDKPDHTAKKLYVEVTQPLLADSLTTDNVKIKDSEENELLCDSVSYLIDKQQIEIGLRSKLKSLSQYTVILNGDVQLENGIPITFNVHQEFSTAPKDVEFSAPVVTIGTDKTEVATTVDNNSTEQTSFVLIATVTGDGGIRYSRMKLFSIAANTAETFSMSFEALESEEVVNVFIWDNLTHPSMLYDKVYTFKKE